MKTETTTAPIAITRASLILLKSLVEDAPNWNGCPMCDITSEQRGNLTQLKKVGLLTTQRDEGIEYAFFPEGEFAVTDGNEIFGYRVEKLTHGDRRVTIV